jgi:hypothetical protein
MKQSQREIILTVIATFASIVLLFALIAYLA